VWCAWRVSMFVSISMTRQRCREKGDMHACVSVCGWVCGWVGGGGVGGGLTPCVFDAAAEHACGHMSGCMCQPFPPRPARHTSIVCPNGDAVCLSHHSIFPQPQNLSLRPIRCPSTPYPQVAVCTLRLPAGPNAADSPDAPEHAPPLPPHLLRPGRLSAAQIPPPTSPIQLRDFAPRLTRCP
jgi:hypothetical protein